MGTRFAEDLIPRLESGDKRAMAGADAVARSLSPSWLDLETVSDEEIAQDSRYRAKGAVPLRPDREPSVVAAMASAVAKAGTPAAMAILGMLKARHELPTLLAALESADASMRVAALRALGEIADPSAAERLAACVGEGPVEERVVAIEALGKLGLPPYECVLIDALADPEPRARRAALFALRPAGERVEAAIRKASEADPALREAAARAFHMKTRPTPTPSAVERLVRGEGKPFRYASPEAAMRMLPEDRVYDEKELTTHIAAACVDYSVTRRHLVDYGFVSRDRGRCELTEEGRWVWRVERFIREHYMR
jgi:hypothetical protein